MSGHESTSTPSTLFGLPLAMKSSEAEGLLLALEDLWKRQMHRNPSSLKGDLEALGKIFHPRRREASVRSFFEGLRPTGIKVLHLNAPLILGPGMLVTPEGRIVIDVLRDVEDGAESDADVVIINPEQVSNALSYAYEVYRGWSLYRVERVIDLREGKGEPLHAAPIGLLLWLLVNRSTSAAHAIRLEDLTPENRDRVRKVIGNAIESFVQGLSGRSRAGQAVGRFDDWPLSEARRRVGAALTIGAIYIRDESTGEVLETVAAELSGRSTTADTLRAFDVLAEVYRQELPVLASLGLANESGSATRRLRQRLGALLVELNRPA